MLILAVLSGKKNILLIRNMVCQRCILTVKDIFNRLGIEPIQVSLGEVELPRALSKSEIEEVENGLKKVGFELIETRTNRIVENIKKYVLEYLSEQSSGVKVKLSSYISERLHYDYSYLSDLFSSIEGITIEQYFIQQRIEKVKELLVYDEMTLTEISYETGFSSVHHLSAQFRKVTGLTPSHFKKIGAAKRRSIDEVN
jgi:AraC-like DNA-binding protein